jgi:cobalamin biosynthesis protein CobT
VVVMELSIFTVVALIGVVTLFGSGVLLIWKGLHSHEGHLPRGADAVLDAIASGAVVPPSRREYGRDMTGEHVRLIPAGASAPVVDDEGPSPDVAKSTTGDVETDDETDDERSPDDRQPVGVAGLRSDDTGELSINQREFFAVEPELKRF